LEDRAAVIRRDACRWVKVLSFQEMPARGMEAVAVSHSTSLGSRAREVRISTGERS